MKALGNLLRLVIRLLGVLAVLKGIGLLAIDLFVVFSAGGLTDQPLGAVWYRANVSSLNLFQAIVQRHISPALWDPYIVTVLGWPAWLALLVTGALALVLGSVLLALTRRRSARRASPFP